MKRCPAVEDPEHVHLVRSVLEHTTLQTGEKFYIHGNSKNGLFQAMRKGADASASYRPPSS